VSRNLPASKSVGVTTAVAAISLPSTVKKNRHENGTFPVQALPSRDAASANYPYKD
jgi:hypothetical protein